MKILILICLIIEIGSISGKLVGKRLLVLSFLSIDGPVLSVVNAFMIPETTNGAVPLATNIAHETGLVWPVGIQRTARPLSVPRACNQRALS